jgi:hypothetical protein
MPATIGGGFVAVNQGACDRLSNRDDAPARACNKARAGRAVGCGLQDYLG